jgi:uncharacterized membrane protein YoaT (DUF817 family)
LSDGESGGPSRAREGGSQHAVGPLLNPLRLEVRAVLARLPAPLAEFILFGLKQAWACLFAALMLALLIGTKLVWDPAWPVHRYDAIFIGAVVIQAAFLILKLESFDEAKVIVIYHVVGTVMEIFKTHVGSWSYPEPAYIRIDGVPLFSGFMYAAVGSYLARSIRIFDMRFTNYPRFSWTLLLSAAIYVNFFTHHYLPDMRWLLFAWTLFLFGRVRITFTTDRVARWMPLVVAGLLTAFFLWVAENVGTATGTWLYPGKGGWQPVSLHKIGSWYLLLTISFVLVTIVNPPRPPPARAPLPARQDSADDSPRRFLSPAERVSHRISVSDRDTPTQ